MLPQLEQFQLLPATEIQSRIAAYFQSNSDRIQLVGAAVFGDQFSEAEVTDMHEWLKQIMFYLYEGFAAIPDSFSVDGFALTMQLALRELLYNSNSWTAQPPVSNFIRLAVPDIVTMLIADETTAKLVMSHECLRRYQPEA